MDPKVLGIVRADLVCNGLGRRSHALERIGPRTVLEITLDRLSRSASVLNWILSTPASSNTELSAALSKMPSQIRERFRIVVQESPANPMQSTWRRARKWSLSNWRGGLLRTSFADEEFEPAEFARLADREQARWVVLARSEAPFIDPHLVDALVRRAESSVPAPPLMYGSLPPGLAPFVLRNDFLAELAENNLPIGYVLGYRAWEPTIDLTEQLFSFKPTHSVGSDRFRYLADHDAGLALARQLSDKLASHESALRADEIVEYSKPLTQSPGYFPAEIEVEITSRQLPGARPVLSPSAVFDMPLSLLERILAETRRYRDTILWISGRGDPTLHPEFERVLTIVSQGSHLGVGVEVDALALTPAVRQSLLASELDVIQVRLDGDSEKSFESIRGQNQFAIAKSQLESLLSERSNSQQNYPLVVVSMIRTEATLVDISSFYDRWTTFADGALIEPAPRGLEGGEIISLEPPSRAFCQRLTRRMTLLADGTVTSCSLDMGIDQPMGNANEWSLETIWTGPLLTELRDDHRSRRFDRWPTCTDCRDWHRP